MTYDADKLAALGDDQLLNLANNVRRLAAAGTPAQRIEAERLTPLIEHELTIRKPAKAAARKRVKSAK